VPRDVVLHEAVPNSLRERCRHFGAAEGGAGMCGSRSEVALRERAAGSRLQIPFESKRFRLGRKLDRHHERPWPMRDGVAGWPFIVPMQTLVGLARDADVVSRRLGVASENVDKSFADSLHARTIARRAGVCWSVRHDLHAIETAGLMNRSSRRRVVRLRSPAFPCELRRDSLRGT